MSESWSYRSSSEESSFITSQEDKVPETLQTPKPIFKQEFSIRKSIVQGSIRLITRPDQELKELVHTSFDLDYFKFPNEEDLPPAPWRPAISMRFPSVVAKARKDNTKVVQLAANADFPATIKQKATMLAVSQKDQSLSKPKMKQQITPAQLQYMAKLLARDLYRNC